MIRVRKMEVADIPDGLRLCREAGWNQVARDWQMFLGMNPIGGFAALAEGKLVGTAATATHGNAFSWIGMVLVDKQHQRQGIGNKLMEAALQSLGQMETIKLDATPAGREVYLKLDFKDEYAISRMQRPAGVYEPVLSNASQITEEDLPGILEFDKPVFGADRSRLLRWIREAAPQLAFKATEGNQIKGYCLARQGFLFTHIGPVVTTEFEVAQSLLNAALQQSADRDVIVDATHFDPRWLKWLQGLGFSEQRPITRMYRGTNRLAGEPQKQFAILGPEFG